MAEKKSEEQQKRNEERDKKFKELSNELAELIGDEESGGGLLVIQVDGDENGKMRKFIHGSSVSISYGIADLADTHEHFKLFFKALPLIIG